MILILHNDGRIVRQEKGDAPDPQTLPVDTIIYRPGHDDPWIKVYKISTRPFKHGWEVVEAETVPPEHRMWQLVLL